LNLDPSDLSLPSSQNYRKQNQTKDGYFYVWILLPLPPKCWAYRCAPTFGEVMSRELVKTWGKYLKKFFFALEGRNTQLLFCQLALTK
jgi:hypothetical protein